MQKIDRDVRVGEKVYMIFHENRLISPPTWANATREDEAIALMQKEANKRQVELSLYVGQKVARSDFIDYERYIKSDAWREKANQAKEWAGHRCQVCNSPNRIQAHHRTYERLGDELPGDITVLCRDCHQLFSEHGKLVGGGDGK